VRSEETRKKRKKKKKKIKIRHTNAVQKIKRGPGNQGQPNNSGRSRFAGGSKIIKEEGGGRSKQWPNSGLSKPFGEAGGVIGKSKEGYRKSRRKALKGSRQV